MSIWDWDKSAANNANVGNITWAEGQLPGTVNNSARAVMEDVAKWRDDQGGQLTLAGGPTAYTLTTNTGLTAYADGMRVHAVANVSNTGDSTFNVDAVGAKAQRKITSAGEAVLVAEDILAGGHHIWEYDASAASAAGAFILLNPGVPEITSVSLGNTGLHVADSNESHDLIIKPGSDLTADRTFTLTTGDADRTLSIGGDVTVNANPLTVGKHTIWIPASAMLSATTSGPASAQVETTTNDVNYKVLDFDASADEHAHFQLALPKSWNLGTVTFQAFWTTTNAGTEGVAWALQAFCSSDGDASDGAWGTAVVVTDDAQTAAGDVYVTAESGAVTIASVPADDSVVFFRVFRDVSDANDDMTQDARLIGIKLFITLDAATDA